jgi:hypothetical protein
MEPLIRDITIPLKRGVIRIWISAAAILLMGNWGAQGQSIFTAPQPVNSTAPSQSVTVAAQVAGTVSTVEVLTLGVASLEFAKGSGASSCESASLSAGATCKESVAFTPAVPGLRMGAVVLLDGNSTVLGTTYLSGTGVGGLGVFFPGNVLTVAGVYRNWSSTQDRIPAINANFEQPSSIAFDALGNMYIADSGSTHNQVRMVCASATSALISGTSCPGAGIIVRIAGTGVPGYSGDGGLASASTLSSPSSLAIDGAGNLFIADSGNNVIRKIDAATGIISTVAGSSSGAAGYSGDGSVATAAELSAPQGVTVDAGGNLYIADTANQRIRRVAVPLPGAAAGIITTVAGNGNPSGNGDGKGTYSGDGQPAAIAGLSLPYGVAFDASGNMYIPDSANNRIRVVDSAGVITTVVGTGTPGNSCGSAATNQVNLNRPSGIVFDAAGNMYIADTQNSCIRKANVPHGSTWPLVWNGGSTIDPDGSVSLVQVYAPVGLALDGFGDIYFADFYDMLIEEIQRNYAVLNYTETPTRQGSQSAPQNLTVENDGNSPLDITAITPDQNSTVNDAWITDACTTGSPYLGVDAECQIGAVFAPSATLVFPPSVTSEQIEANITVGNKGDTANAPLSIQLVGEAAAVNSTTVSISSNNNPSSFGQSVTFTATVATGSDTGNLTGTVSFFDGTTTLKGNVALNAPPGTTVTATFTTTTLTVGSHTITATYNNGNDLNHFSSTSGPLTQIVNESTATSLASSVNPSSIGQSVTFTATVTVSGGGGVVPDGTIGFYDGATILETVPLSATGEATWSTSALLQGAHTMTAIYNGNASKQILASTSSVVNQDVQTPTGILATSTPNPASFGSSVTVTATITPNGNAAPTGVIDFLDGGHQIGSAPLVGSANQASFSTTTLTVGSHSITAAYPGDSNNAANTSAAILQTINKIAPTITWQTPAAILYGTPLSAIQLDASSGGVAGTFVYTPPAGTVLSAGTQTLSVSFAPTDSSDLSPATAAVSLTVNQAVPTLMVSSSSSSAFYNATITLTAIISNGPTGAVTFYDGGNSLGTATLQGTKATLSISSLSVGTHTITASWPGSANYTAVTSSPITQTVNIATPGITWPPPASISYGAALSATQLDATANVSGTFSYSPLLGTVLNAGSRTLSATFTPTDTTDYSTTTVTVILQVNQVTPTITWSAPASIFYGTPLTATQLNASSGGVAGFFYYTPAAGAILPAGLQTLSATFLPSDTTDYSSPTATVSLTVSKATPTIAISNSASPSDYGAPIVFTATVSSGPTGSVSFYDGASSIGSASLEGTIATLTTAKLSVGVHTMSASWPGNSNYTAATSAPISQTVSQTQTATTIAAAPNPGIAGVATALTATVKLTAGVATPTGSVTFADTFRSQTVTIGSLALGASGSVTISPKLAPGTHSIVATYSGDLDSSGSLSTPLTYTVNQATTAVTVLVAPNPVLVLAPITLTATVTGNGGSPTGTVNFYANGTTLLGAASVGANGSASFAYASPSVGTLPITATYAGDTNDAPSTSSAVSEVVGSIPTAAALGYSSSSGTSPQVILAATVVGVSGPTPTGTVEFSSGSTTLGSAPVDATGVATLNPNLTPGVSYVITAAYAGDALHSSSTSAVLDLNGTPTDYAVVVTPSSLSLAQSQNATLSVTVASRSSFADTIGMGCASLPAGVTCHFSALNVVLAANASQSVQLTIDTSNPLGGGATATVAHPGDRSVSLAGFLLPFCVFFGCIFRRFRKRYASVLNAALLCILGFAMLTGCSGITQISAAPGTYVIQVFGAGTNSNVTHFQNVTLTITQ